LLKKDWKRLAWCRSYKGWWEVWRNRK